jgi:hypothetical protein
MAHFEDVPFFNKYYEVVFCRKPENSGTYLKLSTLNLQPYTLVHFRNFQYVGRKMQMHRRTTCIHHHITGF